MPLLSERCQEVRGERSMWVMQTGDIVVHGQCLNLNAEAAQRNSCCQLHEI